MDLGEKPAVDTSQLPMVQAPVLHQAVATSDAEKTPSDIERINAMLRAIERLEEVIDLETTMLQGRQPVDLGQSSDRKSRGMLELVRATQALGGLRTEPRIAEGLTRLRAKLVKNYAVLERHYEAVREVSQTIGKMIRDADSDGTYSAVRPGAKDSK
jgi:hypothetical protein